jgi:hypothetical protein
MHESTVGFISGAPDFVLIEGHDLAESASRFEEL